jgi:flagellar basal body-associated protein FliL
MGSEVIIVLVLSAIAVGFIFWVRMNDQNHEKRREDEKSESQPQ